MGNIANDNGITTITDTLGVSYRDSGQRGRQPWQFSIWRPTVNPYSVTMRVWDAGEVTIERMGGVFETYASMADVVAGNPSNVRIR